MPPFPAYLHDWENKVEDAMERKTVSSETQQNKTVCNCLRFNLCCHNYECENWIDWLETGNCFRRVMRPHTLAEIGIAMGITRERVRQIEEKAMKHLKRAIGRKKEMFRSMIMD